MTEPLTLADLVSTDSSMGDGWTMGFQGGTGTGRSLLAAGACQDGPVLYLNTDLNTVHLAKFFPSPPNPIEYVHFSLPSSDTPMLKQEQALARFNLAWNAFLTGEVSPKYGAAYHTCVIDTHTRLWDFIHPIKVKKFIEKNGDKRSAMNYADANSFMESLADQRAALRPDANLIFILGEEPTWEQNEQGQWFGNEKNPKLDGWKHAKRQCRLYVRLYRRAAAPDREFERSGGKKGDKLKKSVRYGQILKCSDDESYLIKAQELAEPTWEDLKEIMEASSA